MSNKTKPLYDRWIDNTPYYGQTTTYSTCTHAGDQCLFEIDGHAFHPVNSAGARLVSGAAACIDLGGIFTHQRRTGFVDMDETTLPGASVLAAIATPAPTTPVLRLDWPDFGVPPDSVGVQFWRTLLTVLPPGKIAVGCIGSHGRTGTFLSALRILFFQESAPNAINWVRAHHCVKAVESAAQETYLWRLAKTVGTDSQLYDQALADRVNARVQSSTTPTTKTTAPPPVAPPPSVVSYPNLSLAQVRYVTKEQTIHDTTTAEWTHPDYFSKEFRTRALTDSRILIYR